MKRLYPSKLKLCRLKSRGSLRSLALLKLANLVFAWSTRRRPNFRRVRPTIISRAASTTRCARRRAKRWSSSGSGPIRIGQGIEFDYSCVHAAWALRDAGQSRGHREQQSRNRLDRLRRLRCAGLRTAGRGRGRGGVPRHRRERRDARLRRPDRDQSGRTNSSRARRADHRQRSRAASTWPRIASSSTPRSRAWASRARRAKRRTSFREARVFARELGFPVLCVRSFVLGGRGDGDHLQRRPARLIRRVRAADHARRAAAGR